MKHTWKKLWTRRYTPFCASAFLQAFQKRDGWQLCLNKLYLPEGSLHSIYFNASEFQQVCDQYMHLLMQGDTREYATHYEQTFQKWLSWAEETNRRNWSNVTSATLADAVVELENMMSGGFTDYQFFAFVVLESVGREVEHLFANAQNGKEILQSIATPYQHTRMTQARITLLEMVRDGKNRQQDIESYLEHYSWLPVYEFIDDPLTFEQVKDQMDAIDDPTEELKQIDIIHHRGFDTYQTLMHTIDDSLLKKKIEIVHVFSYLKEMRDDYRRPFYYAFRPFWNEIEKRIGLGIVDANYLLATELQDALLGGASRYRDDIEQRKKCFSLVLEDGNMRIESKDLTRQFFPVATMETQEVRGACANPGLVRGLVRIVLHKGEFEKFQDGDVLVSAMTHPEFLPIMKRASAFITDEGGMMCHAAIMAREMKKPCVIGTKIATQIFQDGDMVEVDAELGVVKKL